MRYLFYSADQHIHDGTKGRRHGGTWRPNAKSSLQNLLPTYLPNTYIRLIVRWGGGLLHHLFSLHHPIFHLIQ
jgi:hypothetical protein